MYATKQGLLECPSRWGNDSRTRMVKLCAAHGIPLAMLGPRKAGSLSMFLSRMDCIWPWCLPVALARHLLHGLVEPPAMEEEVVGADSSTQSPASSQATKARAKGSQKNRGDRQGEYKRAAMVRLLRRHPESGLAAHWDTLTLEKDKKECCRRACSLLPLAPSWQTCALLHKLTAQHPLHLGRFEAQFAEHGFKYAEAIKTVRNEQRQDQAVTSKYMTRQQLLHEERGNEEAVNFRIKMCRACWACPKS